MGGDLKKSRAVSSDKAARADGSSSLLSGTTERPANTPSFFSREGASSVLGSVGTPGFMTYTVKNLSSPLYYHYHVYLQIKQLIISQHSYRVVPQVSSKKLPAVRRSVGSPQTPPGPPILHMPVCHIPSQILS